ncbi:hypothetical protein F5880DRAFT_482642 [Lentinula raphanica]|nr:hypothetical protein F5880DRAFT_482642 [Lentinula raphanica]
MTSSSSLSSFSADPLLLPHGPASQPQTPFTTLSSVAMDELYTLERQEALRRAEYEARHAEALRRAEMETRQQLQERDWDRRDRERDRYDEHYDYYAARSSHYGGGAHHTRPRDQHHLRHNHPYLDSYSAHLSHSASHPHSMYTTPLPPSHSSSHSSLSSHSSNSSFPFTASSSTSTSVSTSSYPYSTNSSGFRLSKSATTSPVGTPWERIRERGYFGMSNERGDPSEEDVSRDADDKDLMARELEREQDIKAKRRLSGPAWYIAPEARSQDSDYPLSSSVSTLNTSASIVSLPPGLGVASHPSHLDHPKRLAYHTHRETERSPLSSDSEDSEDVVQMRRRKSYQDVGTVERMGTHAPLSVPHSPKRYRTNVIEYGPPHSAHPMPSGNIHGPAAQHTTHGSTTATATTNAPAYTPSGSPFLGPMKGLNLHSANPSRAPSPILMPPSAIYPPSSSVRDEVVLHKSPSSSPPTTHRGPGFRNKSLTELSSLVGPGGINHGARHPYRDSRGEYHSHSYHGALLHDWDREAVSVNEPRERESYVRDSREKEVKEHRSSGGSTPVYANSKSAGDLRSRDSSRPASPIGSVGNQHAHGVG